MKETQSAIMDYLADGKAANFSTVQTIAKYAGQIARAAIEEESTLKFDDPLPAVYVLMVDGTPIAQTPEKQFDLIILTEDPVFDQEQKEIDALQIVDGICTYAEENQQWDYNGKTYLLNPEKLMVKTLLSNTRFMMIAISLYLKNL